MNLQRLLVSKIDDFGGIEKLTNELCILKPTFSVDERPFLQNVITFLNLLYKTTVDVVALNLQFKDLALETLEVFNNYLISKKNVYIAFISDLLIFQINYTCNIKLLA